MEMEEILNKISEFIALYGLDVIAAIVIFVVGKWVARIIAGIM